MSEIAIPNVSIIIVNWNSCSYLEKCLGILYTNNDKTPFEVIVVDNASYDGSDRLVDKFPELRFFQLQKNLGFSVANNFGSLQARGSILLFLNPDTEPSSGTIDTFADIICRNENAGVVGCLLLNSDKTIQLSSLMPFPTILSEILDSEFILTRLTWMHSWGIKYLLSNENVDSVVVEAISGACMAVKKDVFALVNGFSEDYFMYSEDVDLCYKINKSGKTNLFTNRCKVLHHGGGSANMHPVSAFSRKFKLESKRLYFKLNHSAYHASAFCFVKLFSSFLRILMITVSVPMFLKNISKIRYMYHKWLFTFFWALNSILGSKGKKN